MEDPIKLTEQGIRDMKQDLDKSLEALAQVKAMAIRSNNEKNEYATKAKDYQIKPCLSLRRLKKGDLDAAEADR